MSPPHTHTIYLCGPAIGQELYVRMIGPPPTRKTDLHAAVRAAYARVRPQDRILTPDGWGLDGAARFRVARVPGAPVRELLGAVAV